MKNLLSGLWELIRTIFYLLIVCCGVVLSYVVLIFMIAIEQARHTKDEIQKDLTGR